MSKLICENLHKKYSMKYVVKDVNMEINEGEIVGLLGPNGAGKTTTFKMITGFLKPDKGGVFIDKIEITKYPIYRRARLGLGYLPQEPAIFKSLSVEDNIKGLMELRGFSQKEINERLDEVFKRLGIESLRKQKAGTLSGGERRKVEIARALSFKPRFLLLDEPFAGIDPIARAEIQRIVKELKKEYKIGILVTDHNVRETLQITDRAYLIYDSRIIISGSSEDLIRDKKARELYLGKDFNI